MKKQTLAKWWQKLPMVFGLLFVFIGLPNYFLNLFGLVIGLGFLIYIETKTSMWVLDSWWKKVIYWIGWGVIIVMILGLLLAFIAGTFNKA